MPLPSVPAPRARLKSCGECEALNPVSAETCQDCGASFRPEHEFTISLNSALRVGGIVRGGDFEEEEFQEGEEIAKEFRKMVFELVTCI